MKKEDLRSLQTKLGQEIISDLENSRYSLLDSIGCKKLRLKMLPVGKITGLIIKRLIKKTERDENGALCPESFRENVVKLLQKIAPYELNYSDKIPINSSGLIIGFNHPSLGEILRLISFVSKHYPYSEYLFPINLPWYETLCPMIKDINSVGIALAPIITPSTRKRIVKVAGEQMGEVADEIGKSFNARYVELCRQFIKKGGVIVIAPSATRQRTVFGTTEEFCQTAKINPSSMSLLASMLTHEAKTSEAKFVPVGVKPPVNFRRGLNLFSLYTVGVAKPFSLKEAIILTREKYGDFNGRKFDYEFLDRIATKLAELDAPDLIAP